MSRAALDSAVLEWMREPLWGHDDERFEELALALFAHQFANCAPYERFCRGRGHTPETVTSWRQVPAVPTGAFKELALRSFPAEDEIRVFRTSGSSGEKRGELHLDTLDLYETSLLPPLCRFLLPDLPEDDPEATLLVLAPSPGEARDSSLSHMFGVAIRELGASDSRFFVDAGELRVEALQAALEAANPRRPLLLCGTAFAFVHWLDALESAGRKLSLGENVRIMETGGFKGRSRSLPRTELYLALEEHLDVPVERIVNQYGMTELGSQFYDSILLEPDAERRKIAPPWVRVRIVDPESGEETAGDESGILLITDLANTGSLIAIQTADLGRRIADGFEVLGRSPGFEERGCSIAVDELLARTRT